MFLLNAVVGLFSPIVAANRLDPWLLMAATLTRIEGS